MWGKERIMSATEEVIQSGSVSGSGPAGVGNLQSSVIGVVNTHADAEGVVKELQRSGFDMRKLSVVGKGYHSEEHPLGFYTTGDRMKSWGGIGAFWGGIWGLLFGAAFFWIPGIGPMAVAGPFVHMLVTGLEGAVLVGGAGALGGALMSLGLSKEKVVKYESSLRADKYIIIAHGTRGEVEVARSILYKSSGEEPDVVNGGGEGLKEEPVGVTEATR